MLCIVGVHGEPHNANTSGFRYTGTVGRMPARQPQKTGDSVPRQPDHFPALVPAPRVRSAEDGGEDTER